MNVVLANGKMPMKVSVGFLANAQTVTAIGGTSGASSATAIRIVTDITAAAPPT
jgi:ABC-type molybdate transport system ATPase subunit